MKENPLIQLEKLGQSVWMDFINRNLITSGELRRLIEVDGLSGITSNPAIFEKAISESYDYKHDIRTMLAEGRDTKAIYEAICLKDLQMAADEFRPIYNKTNGEDGYVSMEVDPHLAYITNDTIEEARRLWTALNRPNVFIKIPATKEGLPAIQQLISEGININATLLFGLPRYRQVAEAYISGIELMEAKGKDLKHVASVASFFISRIASLVDPIEEEFLASHGEQAHFGTYVKGHVAISSAKIAYEMYKEIFESERFRKLAGKGARTQKLLWASTDTKNPEYSDIKYVEELIGKDTINTIPPATMTAYRDHGHPKERIELDVEQAEWVMDVLPELGIDIDVITQQLEDEGIDKFSKQFDKIMLILDKTKKV
jgi:transaldolase